jgi:hypothetical protein
MTAKEFIEKRLNELRPKAEIIQKPSSKEELKEFIFKTLMSKKFRKFSVTSEYIPHIKSAIENSIENNLPIKLLFPFGGYKLWRLEENPEADWAELFTLMYLVKWIKPITEVYEPGVALDFSSDDVIVERMNNIPKSDTEAYNKSFHIIISFLEKYIPKNVKITMTPVSSYYTPEEFEEDLEDKIKKMEKELDGLPTLDERTKQMNELNVRLTPEQEKDPLWREKVELIHQSYYTISKRRAYNNAKDKIKIFCMKMDNCIPVGTTKTSTAKFWPGAGALKKTSESFMEYVLSPSQLEKSKPTHEPISIDGLNGKNFKRIGVVKE